MTRTRASLRWAAAGVVAILAPATTAFARGPTGGASAPDGDGFAPAATLGAAAPGPPSPTLGQYKLSPPARGTLVGTLTTIRGVLSPVQGGRAVALQIFDPTRGWLAAGSARATPSGAFAVAWRPAHIGRFMLRALFGSHGATSPGLSAPIEVYRPVLATVFGPGSYGSRTACGQTLTPDLVGVAHRTLPCGTIVDISYANQTISVPVIDRGPYANGASYDLTMAAAAELGVDDTVHIGAVAIRASS